MKFSGKVGNGPMNKRLNFGGIQITDPDPYRDTGETFLVLGRGMHCPSASSFNLISTDFICKHTSTPYDPADALFENSARKAI